MKVSKVIIRSMLLDEKTNKVLKYLDSGSNLILYWKLPPFRYLSILFTHQLQMVDVPFQRVCVYEVIIKVFVLASCSSKHLHLIAWECNKCRLHLDRNNCFPIHEEQRRSKVAPWLAVNEASVCRCVLACNDFSIVFAVMLNKIDGVRMKLMWIDCYLFCKKCIDVGMIAFEETLQRLYFYVLASKKVLTTLVHLYLTIDFLALINRSIFQDK